MSVFVLSLLSLIVRDCAYAEGPKSLCRNLDEETLVGQDVDPRLRVPTAAALLQSQLPEDFMTDIETVWQLIRRLQNEFDVPLSFIEHETEEPLALPVVGQTVEGVLRAVIDQHPHYFCEAFGDRLVLRSSDRLFDVMISGVDLVDEDRSSAKNAYIKHLRASDQRFGNWQKGLFATAGDSPIFYGLVTLSPRAPVVLHLVQLLGQDRALYFEVPAPNEYLPWRTIRFGAIMRPWQRIRHPRQ